MANRMDDYPRIMVLLIALVPVVIVGSLFLDGVPRIAAVVAMVVLAGALGATVRAQVAKQPGAKEI